MIQLPVLNFPTFEPSIKVGKGKFLIHDPIRKKFVILTPEEWVRQSLLNFLVLHRAYPKGLVSVEKLIVLNSKRLRYDAVVYSSKGNPLMLIECKAPTIKLGQEVFEQVAVYNFELKVPFFLITNGIDIYCCRVDILKGTVVLLPSIPFFAEMNS
jgi:hypothetical protein